MSLKVLILILFFFHSGINAYTQADKGRLDSYLFDQIMITGSTNLSHFQLNYSETRYSELPEPDDAHDRFNISIPAKEIRTESKAMLDDFLKMINAKTYPAIHITLDEDITDKLLANSNLSHRIGLTLNGITKNYHIHSVSEECYPGQWCLSGTLRVKLSNFEIEPPKKFFGLVKVGDEVFINFRILFSTNKKGA